MGDKSKVMARHKATARMASAPAVEPRLIRCRHCKKSHREVQAMVEMGGFIFCNECIETAASIIAVRKTGG